MTARYCPGLPDDDYPCGRLLLPDDRAGLCIACELLAATTHGLTIMGALADDHERQPRNDAT
jgi:hypothetical protein